MINDVTYINTKAIFDNSLKQIAEISKQAHNDYMRLVEAFKERGVYNPNTDYMLLNTNKESVK